MIEYLNINKGEGGLSVRAKLNKMFSALITGSEGMNQVWIQMQKILNDYDELENLTEAQYEELKERILQSFDYTDITAADLITYINAMNGGVAGFAETPSYNPNIPEDKAATIIAIGPGTYVNFKDVNGSSIVITGTQSFTVFYKAENSNYWKHKTINLEVTYPPITQELGDSETAVMSQKAVTKELTELENVLGTKSCTWKTNTSHSSNADRIECSIKKGEFFYAQLDCEERLATQLFVTYKNGTSENVLSTYTNNLNKLNAKGDIISVGMYHIAPSRELAFTFNVFSNMTSKISEVTESIGAFDKLINLSTIFWTSENAGHSSNSDRLDVKIPKDTTYNIYVEAVDTFTISVYVKYKDGDNVNILTSKSNTVLTLVAENEIENIGIYHPGTSEPQIITLNVYIPMIYSNYKVLTEQVEQNTEATVYFSGASSPVFEEKSDRIVITMPNANMTIVRNRYNSIVKGLTGKTYSYEVSQTQALYYDLITKEFVVCGTDSSQNINRILMLCYFGRGVSGCLASFYNKYKFSQLSTIPNIICYNSSDKIDIRPAERKVILPKQLRITLKHTTRFLANDVEVPFADSANFSYRYLVVNKRVFDLASSTWSATSSDFRAIAYATELNNDEVLLFVFSTVEGYASLPLNTFKFNGNSILEGGNDIISLNGGRKELLSKFKDTKKVYGLNVTIKPCNILFTSDTHNAQFYLNRIIAFHSEFADYIDDCLHTGDAVADQFIQDNPYEKVTGGSMFLQSIGNHDVLDIADTPGYEHYTDFLGKHSVVQKHAYDKFIAPYKNGWNIVQPDGADANGYCYYYKDYSESNLRLVVLDGMNWNSHQSSWLSGVLDDAIAQNVHVVIANHFPPHSSYTGMEKCTFQTIVGTPIRGEILGNGTHLNNEAASIVQTKIDNGLKFVIWLFGHVHKDWFGYLKDYPKQFAIGVEKTTGNTEGHWESDSARADGRSQDAFDVLTFDTVNATVSIMRIGQNRDKFMRQKNYLTFDYDNGEVLANS